jgi:hypothetical protein
MPSVATEGAERPLASHRAPGERRLSQLRRSRRSPAPATTASMQIIISGSGNPCRRSGRDEALPWTGMAATPRHSCPGAHTTAVPEPGWTSRTAPGPLTGLGRVNTNHIDDQSEMDEGGEHEI